MSQYVTRKQPSFKTKVFMILASTLCVIASGCARSDSIQRGSAVYKGREINQSSDAIARSVAAEQREAYYRKQQAAYSSSYGGQQWIQFSTSIDTNGSGFRSKGTYHKTGGTHHYSR